MAKQKKHFTEERVISDTVLERPLSAIIVKKFGEDEETLKTLAKPKGAKPKRKEIDKDVFKSRILVISPYGQLNAYLDSIISDIVKGGYVDIIDRAEIDEPPYIDAAKREKLAQKPLWLIDFKKIMAMKPSPKYLAEARLRVLASILKDYAGEMPRKKEIYDELLSANEISDSLIDKIVNKFSEDFRKTLDEKLAFEWKKSDDVVGGKYRIIGIVPFDSYDIWRKGKEGKGVLYLNPKELFSIMLEKRHKYDKEGNFLSNAVSIKDYADVILKDLEFIVNGETDKLVLFDKN